MNLSSRHWRLLCSLLFGTTVFLYWWRICPAIMFYHEQFQLFLLDANYIGALISTPDGVARCISEYLVQFFLSPVLGALILAIAAVLLQWLTWCLMRSVSGAPAFYYPLSFAPSLMLWLMQGDESVMFTFAVALLLAVAAMWLTACTPKRILPYLILLLQPLLYWAAGPVVLMWAVFVALLLIFNGTSRLRGIALGAATVLYAVATIVVSAHLLPYPLYRLFYGLDYYRFVDVYYWLIAAIMVLIVVLAFLPRWKPQLSSRWQLWVAVGETVVLGAAFVLLRPGFYDVRKYEVMDYDYLVRCQRWNDIIAKAERKTPNLPATVCATNLALGMEGQLTDRAFEFYQNGVQGLLPLFERNFSTTMLTGEVYWQLGLVNTSQRYAFEAMEAIPNYAKSSRAVKRLAETNLVNGQYAVARKYLHMLEKTMCYRQWARRMLPLLGNEQQIASHPVYGPMRTRRLQSDFLFSEQELDKIFGQLLMVNRQNALAEQYLLLYPLLQRDINTFMNYMTYIDGQHPGYRPRICQEAIIFAFAQRQQQPPRGYIDPLVETNFNDFARTYREGGNNPAALERFKNTTWYYLTQGR